MFVHNHCIFLLSKSNMSQKNALNINSMYFQKSENLFACQNKKKKIGTQTFLGGIMACAN